MTTKYRVTVSSYVIIEAETPDQAKREVIASQERQGLEYEMTYVTAEMMQNSQIESVKLELPNEE